MYSLGACLGHVVRAVRTDPTAENSRVTKTQQPVSRRVEETSRDGGVVLRRTTIEEIEYRDP